MVTEKKIRVGTKGEIGGGTRRETSEDVKQDNKSSSNVKDLTAAGLGVT